MTRKSTTAVALVCFATIFVATGQTQVVRGAQHNESASGESISTMPTRDRHPDGKGRGIDVAHSRARATAKGSRTTNGIYYHNGPIITGTTNVYYIWYGNWDSASQSILLNLASDIGGSRYYNINTTYTNGSGTHVANSVRYNGSASDSYSQGKSFGDSGVEAIVNSAISKGTLPADSHGVYFVLTSADVKETSGFCTSYCGWHTRATIAGNDIKFAFVGNPDTQCPSACEEQTGVSPNGDPGADGMASVIAHELEESATDPDLNAWYDTKGQENADKCAWTFGTTKTAANGTLYNLTLGSRQYLIQRNWVNASGGYCALSY
jgi:hypothetical protein